MAHILVTDDSTFLRRRTIAILKQAGHDISEAADGKQCLALIASQQPDILFLDLVMPELDGFGVLRELKARGNPMPVIILSADIQQGVKQECLDLGAVAFIHKPPMQAEVCEVLDTIFPSTGASS
ncbi:MAG: response regulator [Mariprofundaceae bacterium]